MDKEIIMDGVDVAGCDFYELCGCIDDNHKLNDCKDNPNCYYKQLQRLQQEIAELKAENARLKSCLQEIKEIAEQCMNKDVCFECKYSDDCYIEDAEIPTYDICKLLIQKITKAESEG